MPPESDLSNTWGAATASGPGGPCTALHSCPASPHECPRHHAFALAGHRDFAAVEIDPAQRYISSLLRILDIQADAMRVLGQVLTWAAVALTVVSLCDYLYKNKAVLKEQK